MKKTTAKTKKPAKIAGDPLAAKPASQAPAKKPAVQPTLTTITAQTDVGFGNTLYIRGEGSGLSWDKGLAMDCTADDKWVVTLSDATGPLTFKFLVNDATWCAGNDYVVAPTETVTLVPSFPPA